MGPAVDGADCGEGQVVRRWRMGWRGGDGVATDGERGKRRGGDGGREQWQTGAAAAADGGGDGGRGRRRTGVAADGAGTGRSGLTEVVAAAEMALAVSAAERCRVVQRVCRKAVSLRGRGGGDRWNNKGTWIGA